MKTADRVARSFNLRKGRRMIITLLGIEFACPCIAVRWTLFPGSPRLSVRIRIWKGEDGYGRQGSGVYTS